jgi:hypothetical protein
VGKITDTLQLLRYSVAKLATLFVTSNSYETFKKRVFTTATEPLYIKLGSGFQETRYVS